MDTNTVSFDCVILAAQETMNQLSPFSSEIPHGISIVELRMVGNIKRFSTQIARDYYLISTMMCDNQILEAA